MTWSILYVQIIFKNKGTIAQKTYALIPVKGFGHPQTFKQKKMFDGLLTHI